ncbi:MAG TPA: sugar phosphate isomerase/epimerase family protein, partial [Micromonosporaceae bacterium]
DGVEWRVTDQDPADEPGFWAGNRATIPLTGLEELVPTVARMTRNAGLEMSAIGGYARAADHVNVERMLAATAALGATRVRVTMPTLGLRPYRELFDATRTDLEWVASAAAEHGITALVELHHGTVTASASAARRLLDGLDPANVGVIHDIGNLVIEGYEDPAAGFEILGPYLGHVHVKNVAWRRVGTRDDGSPEWRAEWAPMRDGQADIPAYLAALRVHGYDGWVTVEDFSTTRPLAERTADNLAYLHEIAAKLG